MCIYTCVTMCAFFCAHVKVTAGRCVLCYWPIEGPVMCHVAALLSVCECEITGLSTIPLPHLVKCYRSAPWCSFPSPLHPPSCTPPPKVSSQLEIVLGKVISRLFVFCVAASLSVKKKQKTTGYGLRAVIDE